MPEKYVGLGIEMLYPETWKLEEDEQAKAVTLETPTGSFMTISLCDDLTSAFDQARATMENEYEEVEFEETNAVYAEQPLSGITQRFVYLDLIVTSQLLKIDTGDRKYLVQIQGEDREMEQQQRVFEAILTSLCQNMADHG